MIYKLVEGVVNEIAETFGEEYTIYIDNVPQDLKRPAFFVNTVRTENKKQLDNYYHISHSLNISYFPKDVENPNEEVYNAIEELNLCLEVVTLRDLGMVRAIKGRSVVDEGELHYLIDYNFRVFVPKEKTLMEILTVIDPRLKGEKNYGRS